MSAVAPVLDVVDLRTEFHLRDASVVAVDGVSFNVAEGECVGIVGESGCGKSTTGFSIMRLLPGNGHVTGGSVTLLGRDLAPLDEKEMRRVRGDEVALIPQDPLTVAQPDDDHRPPDHRGAAPPPGRLQPAGPGSGPSRCCAWWRCPGRPSGWTSTPTSCPGGSASG